MKFNLLPLIFTIFFLGCSDIYVNDIDVDYSTSTIILGQDEIPLTLADLGFEEFTQFDINASKTFKDKVGSVSKVTFINLESFELTTTDPTLSIDFLDQVTFYIAYDDSSEALLAHTDNFPMNSTRVLLEVNKSLDLTPYIKSENISIRAVVSGNQPTSDTEIQANLIFLVDTTHSAIF